MPGRYGSGSIMKRGSAYTAKAAAAETASTSGAAINVGDAGAIWVNVNVTAASGTSPTLLVVIEGSNDGGATWVTIGQVGANGVQVGQVGTAPSNFTAAAQSQGVLPAAQYVRYRSVIGGTTPSFTYSVAIEADQ